MSEYLGKVQKIEIIDPSIPSGELLLNNFVFAPVFKSAFDCGFE